jgi:hypothetical protein
MSTNICNIENSILIFEITKKFLVFKILSKELYESLSEDILKNFGLKYVEEKNQSDNFRANINDESPNNADINLDKKPPVVTDDLIYEYLSTIVNSFEISKEIDYTYEYALFNKNSYIIRFMQFKNFLFICLNRLNPASKSSKSINTTNSDYAKLIYSEYYTGWHCKSLISLLKFKFGICLEDKCFNDIMKNEIKNLYLKWNEFHSNEMVYFVEAIEILDVNEDVKVKCVNFMEDLVNFLGKLDIILSEFDFMKNNNDDQDDDSENDSENEDLQFQIEENKNKKHEKEKFKYQELENYFNDFNQFNLFILTYGSKLLYKYQTNKESIDDNNNSSNSSTFAIDSSSMFMLLLEAANFLEYDAKEDNSSRNNNSSENDEFESFSNSPNVINMDREKDADSNFEFSNQSGPSSSYKTPSDQIRIDSSFLNDLKIPPPISEDEITENLDLEKIKKSTKKYKKANCFLLNSNKSLSLYEILYLKLGDNLCLIMLKSNRMSKYCELIYDFDILIANFLNLLQRKRTSMNEQQQQQQSEMPSSPSSSLNRNISPNYNEFQFNGYKASSPNPSMISRSMSRRSLISLQTTFDEKIDKTFVSFFINKLIIFFDKLSSLKNEILEQKSKSKKSKSDNFLSKAFRLRTSLNQNEVKSSDRRSSTSSQSSLLNQESTIHQSNNSIKLIHMLQIKINQFTKMKEFKELINFINNGPNFNKEPQNNESHSNFYVETSFVTNSINISEFLQIFRVIESQINLIQSTLDQLFFELFLENMNNFDGQISLYDLATESVGSGQNKMIKKSNGDKINHHFKSTRLIEKLNELFDRHLYHYTPYMDIKFKRNVAMSFYWHKLPGLIHFTFINRHDNTCFLPSIEDTPEFNLTKSKINLAYRKYMPIALTFLYKNDCTQFQFNDDLLKIVFNYHIWFEDRKSNKIPVDFVNIKKMYNNYNELLLANSTNNGLNKPLESNKNIMYQKSLLANIQNDREQYKPPGITEKSYYDLIKTLCYPNAPNDSLTCYELICIHSNKLSDNLIKAQNNNLINNLSRMSKNQ